MSPRCHCRIENNHILFCKVHEGAHCLYSAVDYVRRMLPTFKPAEEKDRKMIAQIILPYLDTQLKAATMTREEIEQKMDELAGVCRDSRPRYPSRDLQIARLLMESEH
jgi:hypothetical protein